MAKNDKIKVLELPSQSQDLNRTYLKQAVHAGKTSSVGELKHFCKEQLGLMASLKNSLPITANCWLRFLLPMVAQLVIRFQAITFS